MHESLPQIESILTPHVQIFIPRIENISTLMHKSLPQIESILTPHVRIITSNRKYFILSCTYRYLKYSFLAVNENKKDLFQLIQRGVRESESKT